MGLEPEGDIETHNDTVHRQDRWCSREGEAPGYNSSVRGTADARDPDVRKKTLAENGIVLARAGSTPRVVVRAGCTAREQAARSEQFKGSCKAQ